MQKKIKLELDMETNLVTVLKDYNGLKSDKVITISDFIKCVEEAKTTSYKQSVKEKAILSSLYKEYDGCKIIQTAKTSTSTTYVIHASKRRVPIYYDDCFYDDVGMPNAIFIVRVVNGVYSRGSIVCCKDNNITENTILYYYPFSNASNSHICLGTNKIEKGVTDNSILRFPVKFYSMPNTNCAYSRNYNSKKLDYKNLLDNLRHKDFDDELLVSMELTYEDYIKKIILK